MIPTSKLLPLCQECKKREDSFNVHRMVGDPLLMPVDDAGAIHLLLPAPDSSWICKSAEVSEEAPKRRRRTK